jgi:hypothetical protein
MTSQKPIDRGEVDRMLHFGFKCLLDLPCGGNLALLCTRNKRRKKVLLLRQSQVGVPTPP